MNRGRGYPAGPGQLSLDVEPAARTAGPAPDTADPAPDTAGPAPDTAGPAPEPPGGSPTAAARPARYAAGEIARRLGRPEPTPEQVAVIEAPVEPLLVVAGAGSGKTDTMASRVVWLIANGLVAPEQVLGLTFTRKAAGELGERIRARLRALHRQESTFELQPVTVSTYHSYAAGVLADHGLRIGVEPGARLLTEAGAWQLVDHLVQHWDGDLGDVEIAPRTVVDAVLGLAAECAEHLVDLDDVDRLLVTVLDRVAQLPAREGERVPGVPRGSVKDVVTRLGARRELVPLVRDYARSKRDLELLDFGDQVALAARIARGVAQVGQSERDRYRVVLLDEYQDTSHAQLVLLQSLFGGGHPVTAVGDPHQSIYGWRGASAGNLHRFDRDFPTAGGSPARTCHLSTSWRNDEAILVAANRVSAELRAPEQSDPGPDPREPTVPALRARPGAGPGEVSVHWLGTVEDEAAAVAEEVARLWAPAGGAAGRSAAVLCRTRAQFPLVEEALRRRELPVEVVGLGGLLHVPEVADLRATLEVLHDPTRGDSLMRMLTGPAVRLGVRDLDALGAWAAALQRRARPSQDPRPTAEIEPVDERSVVEAIDDLPPPGWRGPEGESLSDEGWRRLARLAGTLRGLRALPPGPLPVLVLEVERAMLLDVEVAARTGGTPAATRAHLDAFLDVAASFADAGDRASLGAFLGWLAAAEQRENALDAGVGQPQQDCVQVLTVHAAKGLEWDIVAVTGLVEGTFPSGHNGTSPANSPGWLGGHGALPFPLRGDAESLPHWRYEAVGSLDALATELAAFKADCGRHEVAEERRLAYVALTRARQRLVLTGALWGDGKCPREPSRFLREVAELAGDAASGVSVGAWVDPPADGATNPREALIRRAEWPNDPLGDRRPAVERGAALVRAAMAEPGATGPAPDSEWAREVGLLLAERDAALRAVQEVELPAHLSASRVVALASDPVALAADLRRPMPQPPSPQARRGSAFHAWLERRFGAAALVDIDELPGAADDLGEEAGEELALLQRNFLDSPWATRTPEAVEVSVETPVGEVVLRGRIDAVFRREDGGWDVVDWKTGPPPPASSAAARAVQLAVYRLAWSRLQGVPAERVGAAFFYASTGQTVRPVDLLDDAGLLGLLEGAVADP